MAGCRLNNLRKLRTVGNAAVVLAPRHLVRIGGEIPPGDVVVRPDFSAAQAAEKRLRLIGAGIRRRIGHAVVDPAGVKADVQRIPGARLIGMDG